MRNIKFDVPAILAAVLQLITMKYEFRALKQNFALVYYYHYLIRIAGWTAKYAFKFVRPTKRMEPVGSAAKALLGKLKLLAVEMGDN